MQCMDGLEAALDKLVVAAPLPSWVAASFWGLESALDWLLQLSVERTGPVYLLRNRRSIYSRIVTRSDLLRVGRWDFRSGQWCTLVERDMFDTRPDTEFSVVPARFRYLEAAPDRQIAAVPAKFTIAAALGGSWVDRRSHSLALGGQGRLEAAFPAQCGRPPGSGASGVDRRGRSPVLCRLACCIVCAYLRSCCAAFVRLFQYWYIYTRSYSLLIVVIASSLSFHSPPPSP